MGTSWTSRNAETLPEETATENTTGVGPDFLALLALTELFISFDSVQKCP